MATITLACQAMATRFEMVLHGEEPAALRAAGEEALNEVERLEDQLSLYRGSSEIASLNARAATGPVKVSPPVFDLLEQAQRLSNETSGAFDITIAPLVRCWGFMHGKGRLPTNTELAEARAQVGMHLLKLNPSDLTVQFAKPGVMLDLGAIGKGYAIDRALAVLREAGVKSALIHGGTSTVYALGHPPEADSWKVAIEQPPPEEGQVQGFASAIPLKNEALSVSAIWAKSFRSQGRTFGHLLDSRTGQPANGAVLSMVILPSATETDALSTALLVGGLPVQQELSQARLGIRTMLILRTEMGLKVETHGLAPERPVKGKLSGSSAG